jgi:hypothetical protein
MMFARRWALLAPLVTGLIACGGGGGGGEGAAPLPSLSGAYQIDATVDVLAPATVRVIVEGLNATLSCRQVSGQVPVGMTFNADCSLSGVPGSVGTSEFVVDATAAGYTGKAQVTVRVGVAGPNATQIFIGQLAWDEAVRSDWRVLVGGARNLPGDVWRYFVSSGRLPRGVTLDESTGAFRGRALEAGSFTFAVTSTLQRPGGVLSLQSMSSTMEVREPVVAPVWAGSPDWRGSAAFLYTPLPIQVSGPTFSPALPVGTRVSFELLTPLPAGLTIDPATGAVAGRMQGGGAWEGQFRVTLTSESGALYTEAPRTLALGFFGPYQLYGNPSEDPSTAPGPQGGIIEGRPGGTATMEPRQVAGGLVGDVYQYELLSPRPGATGVPLPAGWATIDSTSGRVVLTVPNDPGVAGRTHSFRIRLTTLRSGQQFVSDSHWVLSVRP